MQVFKKRSVKFGICLDPFKHQHPTQHTHTPEFRLKFPGYPIPSIGGLDLSSIRSFSNDILAAHIDIIYIHPLTLTSAQEFIAQRSICWATAAELTALDFEGILYLHQINTYGICISDWLILKSDRTQGFDTRMRTVPLRLPTADHKPILYYAGVYN